MAEKKNPDPWAIPDIGTESENKSDTGADSFFRRNAVA